MKSKYLNVAMNRNSICCSSVFVKFGLRISAKMIVLKYKSPAVKNRKSKILIDPQSELDKAMLPLCVAIADLPAAFF